MPPWMVDVAGWVYFVLVIVLVATALYRKKEPAAALGWSLAIVFLPGAGILLFLLFGINRVPRRLKRKIRHHEAYVAHHDAAVETIETLREAGATAPPSGRWGGVSRMLESLEGAPRRGGNATVLYADGGEAFEAMGDAIRQAEDHVHVEFFIFRNDELGRRATDLLCEKSREGVEVRVLVDAMGSAGNWRLIRRLDAAGGRGASFLPLRPFGKRVTPHLRNHRKTVVCDGRVAFFGGLNVGAEYLGRRARGRDWFDLHMAVRGPAVLDLQEMFIEDWDFATGELLLEDRYLPEAELVGEAPVQIVAGGPDQDVNAIRQAFIAALVQARKAIQLITPYLVPDLTLRDALMVAARQGVDVRILTQWPPADHYVVHLCGEHYMEELLEAGVRIHGYASGMMHAKAVVVDGEWAMLGTANFDNRSFHLNYEQMAVLDGPREVGAIADAWRTAWSRSRPYTREGLAARHPARRVLSRASRLLAPLL